MVLLMNPRIPPVPMMSFAATLSRKRNELRYDGNDGENKPEQPTVATGSRRGRSRDDRSASRSIHEGDPVVRGPLR